MPKLSQESLIRTAGQVLEDGRLIELVRTQSDSTQLALLLSRRTDGWRISSTLEIGGNIYTAPDMPTPLLRRMRLAAKPESFGSGKKLFANLVEALRRDTTLTAVDSEIVTFFVIATHFADCVTEAPCIAVMAGERDDALRLLRALGALCRHAIPLAGFRPSAVLKLPSGLCATLLLSGRLRPSSLDCLLASQAAGFGWLATDLFAEGCSSKVIVVDDECADDVLGLASLVIYLAPSARPTLNLDEGALREMADRFQPQLLEYRLRNHGAVRASGFDVPQFAGAIRRVARAFGACCPRDPDLQKRVIELLQPKDDSSRITRRDRLDSVIVEALIVL